MSTINTMLLNAGFCGEWVNVSLLPFLGMKHKLSLILAILSKKLIRNGGYKTNRLIP